MGEVTVAAGGGLGEVAAASARADMPGLWDLPTRRSLARTARSALTLAVFGWAPFVLLVIFTLAAADLGLLGFDFRVNFWDPGHALLAGHSPYIADAAAIRSYESAAYPPPVLLAAAPLSLLPFPVAAVVWVVILVGGVVGALRLVGVRDWRCYSLVLFSVPLFDGATVGNATLLLVPATALAWRYRNHALASGSAVAAAVAIKIFLWPLVVWLLITRRWRAAATAIVLVPLVVLASWATIGFDGLRQYPHLLSELSARFAGHSFSVYSAALAAGASATAAQATYLLLGSLVVALAAVCARRGGGDLQSFSLAVAAAIVLAPIVWPHYFVLLFVPIALTQVRLGWLWVLPLAMWRLYFMGGPPAAASARPPHVPASIWATVEAPPSLLRVAVCLVPFAAIVGSAVALQGRTAVRLQGGVA